MSLQEEVLGDLPPRWVGTLGCYMGCESVCRWSNWLAFELRRASRRTAPRVGGSGDVNYVLRQLQSRASQEGDQATWSDLPNHARRRGDVKPRARPDREIKDRKKETLTVAIPGEVWGREWDVVKGGWKCGRLVA